MCTIICKSVLPKENILNVTGHSSWIMNRHLGAKLSSFPQDIKIKIHMMMYFQSTLDIGIPWKWVNMSITKQLPLAFRIHENTDPLLWHFPCRTCWKVEGRRFPVRSCIVGLTSGGTGSQTLTWSTILGTFQYEVSTFRRVFLDC